MPKSLCRLIFKALILLAFSTTALGVKPYQFPKPAKMENLKVYLLTVGLGEELYMRYGHSLLYIVNEELPYSAAYNWGMFSFDDPKFPIKFFMGDREYWVDQSTMAMTMRIYEYYENRKVVQNEVFLTNKQKENLLVSLNKNFLGDNVYFQYDHFYKNCTTYIRDHFNHVLGGELKRQWQEIPATMSLRDYVRINLNSPPIVGFSLDVIMNESLDIALDSWQEAFYPKRFQDLLLELPQFDDSGNAISGTKLLGETELLFDAPSYPESPVNFGWLFLIGFSIPTILGLSLPSKSGKLLGLKTRLVGLGFTGYILFSSIFGLLMFLGLFSKVRDIQGNWNLLLFWPTDLLILPFGMLLLFFGRRVSINGKTWSILSKYLSLHLYASLVWAFLAIFSLIEQNVSQVLWSLFPSLICQILALQWIRFGSLGGLPQETPAGENWKQFAKWVLLWGGTSNSAARSRYKPSFDVS